MAEPDRTNLRRAHRPPRPVAAVVARLPKGADGRPLRARQRLVVAALLLLVGGALLSPALEAARTSFAGSGSTGVAALGLGCRFLGFELDPQQADAANRRLAELPRPEAR